jgi:hypothetical protein
VHVGEHSATKVARATSNARALAAVQGAAEAAGERRLADAAGAGDEQRVVQAAAGDRVLQRRRGSFMSNDVGKWGNWLHRRARAYQDCKPAHVRKSSVGR